MQSSAASWARIATVGLLLLTGAAPVAIPATGKLRVVTTVSPITDIVRRIGGDLIELHGVIPEGMNSHTFEPAPTDAKRLSRADLIIVNGLDLEISIIRMAEAVRRASVPIVRLGDRAISRAEWRFDASFPEAAGHPNPHLWLNVALAMRYVELARDAMVDVDPKNRDRYFANATAYLARLSRLDAAIFVCVASIPESNRKLVTYHDSFAYFAPRYGMRVVGAVQPADFAEPSPKDVVRIIQQLRRERVPAVFGSEVFPSKVLEQVAREAGATFVDQLRDDELPGSPDDPHHSFIGMMVNNMTVMTGALGGDPKCVSGIDG